MNIILPELKKVCITILVLNAGFLGIAIPLSYFDYTILVGLVYGDLYTMFNFVLLGTVVEKAITKSPGKAKSYIHLHYAIRFAITGFIVAVAMLSPHINPWIVCLTLFAPKLTYYAISYYEVGAELLQNFQKRRK